MLEKDYQEIVPMQFDFTAALASETIASTTITIYVTKGTDAAPQSVLLNAQTTAGAIVTQWLTGGVIGVIYHLRCKVLLNSGRSLVVATDLLIRNR